MKTTGFKEANMKILVAGDWHGNTGHAMQMVREARKAGVKKIVQCGDFGLWDHLEDGVRFLDQLNEAARKEGVKIYAVGGNHENWDRWDWYVENNPKSYHGFAYLRSHVLLAPRVHYWGWEGKKFLMVAGAVSVDKQFRRPGHSWWANEATTDEHVAKVNDVKVDYLFTHDCSNRTPFRGRMKPDLDSQYNRQQIDRVLAKARPEMHFHGHMHTRYVWENMVTDLDWTKTIGLDMDGTWDAWGILNIETGEFLFRNEFPVQWNRLGT
jgi:predicted phosphodiesterase